MSNQTNKSNQIKSYRKIFVWMEINVMKNKYKNINQKNQALSET